MRRTPGRLLLAMGVVPWVPMIAILSSAQGQTQAQPQGATPNWIVNCSNQASPDKLNCTMSQTIQTADTRQRVLAATISGGSGSRILVLALPHGLDLPSGVVLGVDTGKTEKFPINTSDANAAYARIPLSAEILLAMKAGSKINLQATGALGRTINLELSLDGFSKAYDLMASQ